LNKKPINCDVFKCPLTADYAFYPNAMRQSELVVFLCSNHRNIVLESKERKEQMYKAASSFVTKSLG